MERMSHDPRSPSDAADHDPYADQRDWLRGRNANMAGKPRDPRQNIDWLTGWDDAQDDRCLDDEDRP
jgi:ribosome modulation factor